MAEAVVSNDEFTAFWNMTEARGGLPRRPECRWVPAEGGV
jgi:hypothetical protein